MEAMPSVNWCPGSLRPYESRLSLVTRFSRLNGLSARRCLEFLNVGLDDNRPLPDEDIRRLASVLHETQSLVEDVFSPSIRFLDDVGRYGPPAHRRERHAVRFCEVCAQHGYHSYLHEVGWLSRCPFHMSELKNAVWWKANGSLASRRMGALECVMRTHCRTWPHGVNLSFPASGQRQVAPLAGWVARASAAAVRLSRAEIWRSGDGQVIEDRSFGQAFGQLRTLEPMPPEIESLFTAVGDQWSLEIRAFSQRAKIELDRLRSHRLGFARVFDFYKRIQPAAAKPPSFVAYLRVIQDLLKVRHGSCHCHWRLIDWAWRAHWIRVRADEGTDWNATCPFDVAFTELEVGWGRANLALSTHYAEQERLRIVVASYEMREAGLIHYTKGAMVSPHGNLYADQDVWAGCEWVQESPLTELLDVAARWEIELAFGALTTWLDDIDRGVNPRERDDPQYSVRLCETEKGLSLTRWAKKREGEGDAARGDQDLSVKAPQAAALCAGP